MIIALGLFFQIAAVFVRVILWMLLVTGIAVAVIIGECWVGVRYLWVRREHGRAWIEDSAEGLLFRQHSKQSAAAILGWLWLPFKILPSD